MFIRTKVAALVAVVGFAAFVFAPSSKAQVGPPPDYEALFSVFFDVTAGPPATLTPLWPSPSAPDFVTSARMFRDVMINLGINNNSGSLVMTIGGVDVKWGLGSPGAVSSTTPNSIVLATAADQGQGLLYDHGAGFYQLVIHAIAIVDGDGSSAYAIAGRALDNTATSGTATAVNNGNNPGDSISWGGGFGPRTWQARNGGHAVAESSDGDAVAYGGPRQSDGVSGNATATVNGGTAHAYGGDATFGGHWWPFFVVGNHGVGGDAEAYANGAGTAVAVGGRSVNNSDSTFAADGGTAHAEGGWAEARGGDVLNSGGSFVGNGGTATADTQTSIGDAEAYGGNAISGGLGGEAVAEAGDGTAHAEGGDGHDGGADATATSGAGNAYAEGGNCTGTAGDGGEAFAEAFNGSAEARGGSGKDNGDGGDATALAGSGDAYAEGGDCTGSAGDGGEAFAEANNGSAEARGGAGKDNGDGGDATALGTDSAEAYGGDTENGTAGDAEAHADNFANAVGGNAPTGVRGGNATATTQAAGATLFAWAGDGNIGGHAEAEAFGNGSHAVARGGDSTSGSAADGGAALAVVWASTGTADATGGDSYTGGIGGMAVAQVDGIADFEVPTGSGGGSAYRQIP